MENLIVHLETQRKAIESLLDFAGTVAPHSSYWDDIWPEFDSKLLEIDLLINKIKEMDHV